MLSFPVHVAGTTGTGRSYIAQTGDFTRAYVEFEVTAVGATPTVTFQVEGLMPGSDPTVAANWIKLSLLQADASVATSNAAIVTTTVGKTQRYVDGLTQRSFDAIAVSVTANTNVTFKSTLYAL